MGTKVYDNALDLLTFSRASGGTSLRKISYGSELVTNGTFDTDSDWAKGGDWSIADGTAKVLTATGQSDLSQSFSVIAGRTYEFSVDVISFRSSAAFAVQVANGFSFYPLLSVGTFKRVFVATSNTTTITFRNQSYGSGVSEIDNISVKEVLFDQPDGTLTLFNHPDNIPRIDYNADGTVKGLLIEEQRTNLLTYSEDFSSGNWSISFTDSLTLTAGASSGPDGELSLTKVEITDTTNESKSLVDISTFSASTTYCSSFFVKNIGQRYVGIWARGQTNHWILVVFDLESASVVDTQTGATSGTVVGSDIVDWGNGIYRIWASWSLGDVGGTEQTGITFLSTATPTLSTNGLEAYVGTAGVGIYAGFAQFEEGSFPTSYIPTSGSTATRSADIASIPVTDFGYNQKSGTVVVEIGTHAGDATGSQYVISLDDSSISDRIQINRSTGDYRYFVADGNVTQVSQSVGLGGDGSKVAFAYALNNFAATEDGDTPVTDTVGTVPIISKVSIGMAYNSTLPINGHIKSIQYFPRRLSNQQLVDLTS
jgi:hypothetical protein